MWRRLIDFLKYEFYPAACEKWHELCYPHRHKRMNQVKEDMVTSLCASLSDMSVEPL